MRSGTAARLAGLPVTTLRVWERRYGVVAAPRSETGQRLYSAADVQRLSLLKRLTDCGHAIGTIATLALEQLQALAFGEAAAPGAGSASAAASAATAAPATAQPVVVIGRIAALKLGARAGAAPQRVFEDLAQAEAQAELLPASATLLVHLPSLQPALAERTLALAARVRAAALVVLYAFGAEALADSLRVAGAVLRREPVSARELAQLVSTPRALPEGHATAPPRRFSDEALLLLAEQPSSVACECPRHLAEIVTQLGSFERYSADCLSRSPADAALHRHLSALAGTARALFEQALERVAVAEGLDVPG
jgi:DNA-binding transcriptional MerR regulator